MGRITIYASALTAAFFAFAVTGGIQASEKVVKAEEHALTPAALIGADAEIPFANSGNIRDWHADGTNALYVEDARGRWYHASLIGSCMDLPTANQIAFLTRGPDQLDKFSAISVHGRQCQFSALVTSAGPPKNDLRSEKVKAAKG